MQVGKLYPHDRRG